MALRIEEGLLGMWTAGIWTWVVLAWGLDFRLKCRGGLNVKRAGPGGSDYKNTCYLAHISMHSFHRVHIHRKQLHSH